VVPPDYLFGGIHIAVGVFVALAAALLLSNILFYQRVIRLILLGKKVARFDHPLERIKGLLSITIGQRKVLQRVGRMDRAGLGHVIIFWGFLSFLLSYLIFIFGDSIWRPFSEKLLTSKGVELYSIYLDILAASILFALGWAVLRRWVAKPHRLTFDLTRSLDSVLIVSLIASLMLLTLLTEAFYVARGSTGPAGEAILGHILGDWFTTLGLDQGAANSLHIVAWWLHLGVILGFSIYIPFSKHMHMVATPPNAFFRSLEPRGALPAIDLENAEHFGAGKIQDFTWKELLDGYACAVCGRCTDSCPAHLTGKVLSPMHIVENLKDHLIEVAPYIRNDVEIPSDHNLIGNVIEEEAIWDCVNCGACMEECPVLVEHIPTIMDMRRHLVMEESKMPETAKNALLSMEQRGHPWRGTQFSRTDWTEGLETPTLADHPNAEILFWVGCTAALEQRSQAIARSMAKVLKAAGVDFAILGEEERCTGDPARRMGNEYLYQTMASQNIETFNRYNIKKIVTVCPHCFNTIKNEYPQFGGNYEVLHYSQFLDQLISAGKLKLLPMAETTVAYHDSCFLGRHNGIYDQPRRIAQAIPGLKLVEMERRRERGFCCGAGGGHMWIEESRGDRINHVRTDHFLDTDASTVAVSCPFCLQMLTEGIEAKGQADQKQAKDILELVADNLAL
jgi:Fe-S oxidoreductase